MKKSIKIITAEFDIIDYTRKLTLDTKNTDWFGKSYIVFYLNTPITSDLEITKLFDTISFNFNGIKSSLSSEFILMLLKLYTEQNIMGTLEKMLRGNTIYLPIGNFFYGKEIYVKNQQVQIEITGTNPSSRIEFLYDSIVKPENESGLAEKKFLIQTFYICEYDLAPLIKIPIKTDYIQEIFWIYKDQLGNQVNPVNWIDLISEPNYWINTVRKPEYWTIINQFLFHSNSNSNPNLYLYSFVLHPENAHHIELPIVRNYFEIRLEQEFRDGMVNTQDIKQIVCVKSISLVELV